MAKAPKPDTSRRAAALEAIIPSPPAGVAVMRDAFSLAVGKQWQRRCPRFWGSTGKGSPIPNLRREIYRGDVCAGLLFDAAGECQRPDGAAGARHVPADLRPDEQAIAVLARAARQNESVWQTDYWERVLLPAVRQYCRAEVFAVQQIPDATGMGHRQAGIEAVDAMRSGLAA